ncbi:penicillin acylase family protein [Leucobacter soli]|uniref:Acyl-homoserine lactone acylase QuiP n=1 Tax=Leucobacter soli TaxID=2812850 RepID=A0A916JT59_9MICO|nr:penicillin acylase family protein [Leucobacter soli]CAG7601303.1 Acyl-homoserine lactone acylase QuiP [Leucobacter soli]
MTQPDGPISEAEATQARPKRKKRRLLRFLGWTLATLLVLALVAGGFGVWTVMRSWPQTSGTLDVAGLEQTVTVQRDKSGIPTITATNTRDLFIAQGFVHAQDRFWEMDMRRHVTSGRLSELFGESQVGTDTFLRTLGWHDIAQQEVDALPAETRGYYEAYAEGVNAYLAQRSGARLSLEYAVLGLQNADYAPEPWTPADSVAWLKAMAWDLRTNIEEETERALLAQRIGPAEIDALYPDYPFDEHPVIVDREWGDTDRAEGDVRPPLFSVAPAGADAQSPDFTGSTDSEAATALDALAVVDAMLTGQGEGIGSNSWIVSGEHTETGLPLLANDPHLGAELPSVWNQMQLRCADVTEACPFDVAGFSFSGLPGIVIGHNDRVAWGFTNLTTDVADLYIERVDGGDYWLDGEKQALDTRTETLKVAGGDDVTFEVRSTGHGPILSGLTADFTAIAEDPRYAVRHAWGPGVSDPQEDADELERDAPSGDFAVSLRWTALDPGSTAQAIFDLNLAQSFDDFRVAASNFDVPAQNLVYADVDGNIGYQTPGRLPIRGAGNGWLPQPGWASDYDWQGFIPFAELPTSYNPESGYIVTANNAIVSNAYPYELSWDWDYGYRAARIVELLEQRIAAGPLTADDLHEIQLDNQMPAAGSLQTLYADVAADDPAVQQALDGLAEWDGQNDADSSEAAYANVLWRQTAALFAQHFGDDIPLSDQSRFALLLELALDANSSTNAVWNDALPDADALALAATRAYEELSATQGTDQSKWNWGKLHALPLTHGTFGESGIAPIEWLFNRGPYPTGGGSGVVNATGWTLDGEDYATETVPSLRMVVDVSDWDASNWVNLTGQSGHAFHTHYVDQTKDWANGVQRPWAYSPEAVDAATADTLTLQPAP